MERRDDMVDFWSAERDTGRGAKDVSKGRQIGDAASALPMLSGDGGREGGRERDERLTGRCSWPGGGLPVQGREEAWVVEAGNLRTDSEVTSQLHVRRVRAT